MDGKTIKHCALITLLAFYGLVSRFYPSHTMRLA